MKVARKYGLVRVIAFILKLLAWLILLLFIAGAIFGASILGRSPLTANLPAGVGTGAMITSLVMGILWFVPLYALGSVLTLLLHIEENTRAMATYPTGYEGVEGQPQA